MEVLDAIKERRSIRKYQPRAVEEEKINKVLEAGRWAPSGSNRQPWRFVVVTKDRLREKLRNVAHDQSFVEDAPVVLVICNKKGANLVNLGLAMQNMCLAAYALGLGTCIVGWFDKEPVQHLLRIPEAYEPSYLIPMGYPAEEPTKGRKPFEELVHFETW
ncbi:MAG: nitroreductase [Candidatus Korarchaeota archaeon]|nr:nitroreductase [Candidatus Korarchaeota archaeon]NIU85545.1 nitroreductase [Candidatus Thorarchaeota archaeon]NIW15656.1 nitroreductase [Candidatus Thorarchaeota archaeon]NIW53586.1 nitroreductase [Candidatus Korarchaeota archaeon]